MSECATCTRLFETHDTAKPDQRKVLAEQIEKHVKNDHPEIVAQATEMVRRRSAT